MLFVFILLAVSSSSIVLMRRFVAPTICGSEVHFAGIRVRATAQHLASPRTPSLLSLEIPHLLAVESFVALAVASGGHCQTGKTQSCQNSSSYLALFPSMLMWLAALFSTVVLSLSLVLPPIRSLCAAATINEFASLPLPVGCSPIDVKL
ncbi:hypothetical protein CY34DRAFT_692717 [Suillus luteus UH-Slu-Lm8-n1]|uniref:Secreted protein n=1 Tax=Suillus luteus UH-Slu-Lm8-n1 TaxID=930992 RepID=A0A0D0BK55_9AGAM|nr:hypothetical protein CY34DRAFT_692717 [Suillus luteus UH-Slu-Lm8-n1]